MTIAALAIPALAFSRSYVVNDSVCTGFSRPLEWHIGTEVYGGYVPSTNGYLHGENPDNKTVDTSSGIDLRLGFSFDGETYPARIYKGIYQGIGVGVAGFMPGSLLGNPATAYVFQGAPLVTFGHGFSLNYEWKFGIAAGWRHHVDEDEVNAAVSTPVTALMGIGLKLQWEAGRRVRLWAGVEAHHYSNGNTSFPNSGVNSIGGTVGVSYVLSPRYRSVYGENVSSYGIDRADQAFWMWDIMAYGAWRKRVVYTEAMQQVCPGCFAVAGLLVSRMRQLNRWVAVGPSLDLQWDESGSLAEYWVDGTYDDNIKFYRPPFGKQIKVGLSAHAELTAPIFHVNAGLGYDIVNPRGDKRFYQSISLKTFLARGLYLNVGYRLGDFSTPQNLMLGLGYTW